MYKIILSLLTVIPLLSIAQQKPLTPKQIKAQERKAKIEKLIKQEEEGALIFHKQSAFGLKFNTDGFSFLYEKGKFKTVNKTNLWWLELGERKDNKQERLNNITSVGNTIFSNSFVYAKERNFYYFKAGLGQQRLIGNKGTRNGVAVSAIYGGGLTIAMMKPYYLEVREANSNNTKDIKYSPDVANIFLDPNNIVGASGFTKGINEIKYIPGLHLRTALRFDYGHYNDVLSAIEVGLMTEFYTQKTAIMVGGKERNLFLQAYVAIEFGKRK